MKTEGKRRVRVAHKKGEWGRYDGEKGKEGKKEGLGDIIFGGRSKSHNAISCRVDECSPGCDCCPSPTTISGVCIDESATPLW